ncbi:hypothetical protein L249_0829 [Ophiocordyceps polyrhachis-furcata BCC 54312]|uniref:Uncharacterized protein n=1 Tax=Ophiocordyceps polyrhachis-furcata BCC 54312 TaxID=1330021 RepID=A0A367LFM5_9HYPO|nr:hypothetical protein L249_0829 [Ophiocordyceps polyrhachis-furcata BCC 54312]
MINSCMCHIPLATHKPQLTISAYRLSGDLTVANMRKPYCRGSMFFGWQGFSKVSRVPQGPEREPLVRISSLDEGTFDDADRAKATGLAEIVPAGLFRCRGQLQVDSPDIVMEAKEPDQHPTVTRMISLPVRLSTRDGSGFRATTTRKSNSSAGMGKVTVGLGK